MRPSKTNPPRTGALATNLDHNTPVPFPSPEVASYLRLDTRYRCFGLQSFIPSGTETVSRRSDLLAFLVDDYTPYKNREHDNYEHQEGTIHG